MSKGQFPKFTDLNRRDIVTGEYPTYQDEKGYGTHKSLDVDELPRKRKIKKEI